jgi:TonB family protein
MTPSVRTALLAWLLGALGWAAAMPALADEPVKPPLSAEERAQKQADRVFTFIRLHTDKAPAKRVAPAEAAATPGPAVAIAATQAKALAKPQSKPALAGAAPADARPTASVEPAAEPLAPATLLAAASLSAASVQPELLPQPQALARQAEPEPPALQLLSKVEPEIPRQLQADFKGGSVTLRFVVQPDGSVAQTQALKSSHKRLTVAAIAAVNQWRFAPLPAPREATVDIAFAVE